MVNHRGVGMSMSNEGSPRVTVRLRAPEANQPEFLICIYPKEAPEKRHEFVVPITFTQLRTHARDVMTTLMHYPVKEVPLE